MIDYSDALSILFCSKNFSSVCEKYWDKNDLDNIREKLLQIKDEKSFEIYSNNIEYNVDQAVKTYDESNQRMSTFLSATILGFTVAGSVIVGLKLVGPLSVLTILFLLFSILLNIKCYCGSISVSSAFDINDKDFLKETENCKIELVCTRIAIFKSHELANEYKRKILALSAWLFFIGLILLSIGMLGFWS